MHKFKTIQLSDVSLRAAIQGHGPLVVMVHGFPESWYSWRHQMDPVADAGFTATVNDIEKNDKNLKIVEVEAAQIPRSLQDVDMAVINGNYALSAGIDVSSAIAKEEKDSDAAQTYANIIAVRKGDETREDLKALVAALQSAEVTKYITDTYKGAVVPMA